MKTKSFKSLKEIFEDIADHKAYTGKTINPDVSLSASDIRASLRTAEESENDYYNTVTYGIETDTGEIVKVYIDADDEAALENFEKDLAAILGEEDNIEEILNMLDDKYNIVDVDWPDSVDDADDADVEETNSDDEEDLDPIPSDEEIINKIKADLSDEDDVDNEVEEDPDDDPEEDSEEDSEDEEATSESIEEDLTEQEEELDMQFDPEMKELLKKYGRGNRYTEFGLVLLRDIGIPAEMISYILRRQPDIRISIMNSMRDLGQSKRLRIANAMEFDPKIADDIKNQQAEGIDTKAEMIVEDDHVMITDNVNFELQLDQQDVDAIRAAMVNNQTYTIANIDGNGNDIQFIPNVSSRDFEVKLPNGDSHTFTLESIRSLSLQAGE